MSRKRAIDKQRDAAFSMRVGGDDHSGIMHHLSTGNALYVIKEEGVYQVKTADDIDPERLNPHIPHQNQQVLPAGYNHKIVGKILLTAKTLFDKHNATVEPFVAALFENSIVLTRQILELDAMVRELTDEITRKENELEEKPFEPNAVCLPTISGMDTKVHNILSKADKAKNTIIDLFRLQFMPGIKKRPLLEELDKAVEKAFETEPQLIEGWKANAQYFKLIRNARNASEHPDEHKEVAISDFAMWPDGKIYPPLVELKHKDTPIRLLPLAEFLDFIRNTMLEQAEYALVVIRHAGLLQHNPFKEGIAEFPEEERHHKFVRFYRAINFNGEVRILG
jgi:hypothetical protein